MDTRLSTALGATSAFLVAATAPLPARAVERPPPEFGAWAWIAWFALAGVGALLLLLAARYWARRPPI